MRRTASLILIIMLMALPMFGQPPIPPHLDMQSGDVYFDAATTEIRFIADRVGEKIKIGVLKNITPGGGMDIHQEHELPAGGYYLVAHAFYGIQMVEYVQAPYADQPIGRNKDHREFAGLPDSVLLYAYPVNRTYNIGAMYYDDGQYNQIWGSPPAGTYYVSADAYQSGMVLSSLPQLASFTASDTIGRRFTITAPLPAKVALIYPPDGAVFDIGADPLLQWQAVEYADHYQLQIIKVTTPGTAENFIIFTRGADTVHGEILIDVDTSGTEYQLSGNVPSDYYWRVRAVNAGGPGEWSSGE